MPADRIAEVVWVGGMRDGTGTVKLGSGYEATLTAGSRMGDDPGTNPEEMIGAALAGCFTMALGGALARAGHPPTRIATTAAVRLERNENQYRIPTIQLKTIGVVPGLDAATFSEIAEEAKVNCPVSKALAGVESIELDASLG